MVSALVLGAALAVTAGSFVAMSSGAAGSNAVACQTGWLTAKTGRASAAAGTSYYTLEIVNHSAQSCTLKGIPVARPGFNSYGMPSFAAVGPPAVKESFAGRGNVVVMRTGKIASVELGIGTAANYPRVKCAPRTITEVDVAFSMGKTTAHVEFSLPKQAVCTKLASTNIAGIALGTHFP